MRLSPIMREMGTLAGGNVLAQTIGLAAYFVLTRIYSPDDFGLFAIFYSYIEVLIIFSTGKYELAAVTARSDAEAAAVSRFALRMNAVVSALLLGVALLLWMLGGLPGKLSRLGWMVTLIPPMVFFCGTSRVYSFLFNRAHRYRTMALSETVNSASAALIKVALGLIGLLQSGLPVGTVAGRAVANLCYRLRLKSLSMPATTRGERLAAAKEHRRFPLFVATKDFVNAFSGNLPFLWLAVWFDQAEVGLFSLALTFTFRPVNILNGAFEQVLYARTAEGVRRHESIAPIIKSFLLKLNVVALPVAVLAWFAAEPLFGFFFGGRWTGCGVYVRALLPWVYIALSSTSLMFVSNVFSTQRTEFFFYLAMLALRVAAIAAGIHAGSFLLGIRLYAAAGMLVAASLLVWYLWQMRRYERTVTC
ncbi:MAG: oligosaccharide flippase family protein [Bacteroidales bacterium]|nr:oligosaccharide flippase family protein [Bacteroidales bacterium]